MTEKRNDSPGVAELKQRAMVRSLRERIKELEQEGEQIRESLLFQEMRKHELEALNRETARANAYAAELAVDLEERNQEMEATNVELARANAHAAELMADIELKDERIMLLNDALAAANSRAADLLAELEIHMEEVLRSNEELDCFASAVSHDLINPLRTVIGFLSLAGERFSRESISDTGRYLSFAEQGAGTMMKMLENLLYYSRLGAGIKGPVPVNLEKLLARMMEGLVQVMDDAGAVLTHDPLPEVIGFEIQLERLFQNLVANAIKFRGDEPPRVHVSVDRSGGELVLSVEDNGIGIAHEQQDRIFKVFQRLHTAEEYSGAGMGLAFCKKIVGIHGGRIWVESEPGKGSKFKFTLPEKT